MPTKVKDVMIRDVKTANIRDTVLKAAEIMNRHEIGCIIVTENGNPVGILTERDILKRVVFKRKDPARTKAIEVMSKPLVTVKSHVTIARATRKMIKQKIKKLAVTNAGHLVGILSLTDLIPLLETEKSMNKISLKDVPKRMKRVFEIYYDPKRQIRKKCPLTMGGGMSISCIGSKCMWYVNERCVITSVLER
ncbi:MAG: CBS domain-containing protein [Candidatus Bathyarchaeota archaeon]|nr:CBS domain-containing protein [Candidatus Bathyarchaeota archaeon]MDH5495028.1 CBS domain-containing protein [Candidatus Bathyarchaeota archaeon]